MAKLRGQFGKQKQNRQNKNGAVDVEAVAQAAYEFYEQRGRQDGFDQEDWLKAEAMCSNKGEENDSAG